MAATDRASDDELLADVDRVAEIVERSPSKRDYERHGHWNESVVRRRFGSWGKARIAYAKYRAGPHVPLVIEPASADAIREIAHRDAKAIARGDTPPAGFVERVGEAFGVQIKAPLIFTSTEAVPANADPFDYVPCPGCGYAVRYDTDDECAVCEAQDLACVKVAQATPAPAKAQVAPTPRVEVSEPLADPVERREESDKTARLKREHSHMVDMLKEERARNAFLGKLHEAVASPRIDTSEKASGLREMTVVAMGSDWHVEEPVDGAKIAYRNEYNLEIADKRVARFFRGIEDLVEHHRASGRVVIRDMVLAFSGDLMSGYIHPELQETNQLSPVETALWLQPRIRNGVATLLDRLQLRSMLIPWSYGNHGRTTHKSQISTGAENSYEWMLGRMMEREFANDKRVQFDTSPSSSQYVEVYGKTLHFHHGDSLKYQGGVGGLGIPLLKAKPAWDDIRYSDISHVGHWHTLRDYGRAMVNGSLIGFGPYSQWIRAAFEPPQQLFYMFDSKRGKCHVTPIHVSELSDDRGAPRVRV